MGTQAWLCIPSASTTSRAMGTMLGYTWALTYFCATTGLPVGCQLLYQAGLTGIKMTVIVTRAIKQFGFFCGDTFWAVSRSRACAVGCSALFKLLTMMWEIGQALCRMFQRDSSSYEEASHQNPPQSSPQDSPAPSLSLIHI